MSEQTPQTETIKPEDDIRLRCQTFQKLLNKEPEDYELVDTADRKAKSMAISHVEMKLDELFFGQWSTRNFVTKQVLNEFVGEIELVCIHPITGREMIRVGAASVQITQDSGAAISEFMQTKKKNALDLAYPKLKAECVKNAAQSLGKAFGRDVNRKVVDDYQPILKKEHLNSLPPAQITAIIEQMRGLPKDQVHEAMEKVNLNQKQRDQISNTLFPNEQ